MSTINLLIIVAASLFVVLTIVGLIVDKKSTWKILKGVLMGLGAVLLGWVATKFKINIGKHINNLFGNREKMPTAVVNDSGEEIGEVVEIVHRKNPVRDRGIVETSTGEYIELPKGISDDDVEKIIHVDKTLYHVETKHEAVTDIFDSDPPA